jgi:hypothetical protein
MKDRPVLLGIVEARFEGPRWRIVDLGVTAVPTPA